MKNAASLLSLVLLLGASPIVVPALAQTSAAGEEIAPTEVQMQRLLALYREKVPEGGPLDAARASREFLEHLRLSSPLAAERLLSGRMDDADLGSRLSVFLKDRPALSGRAVTETTKSPRIRVAELLKSEPGIASDDAERLALADRFLAKLGERSSLASESLKSGAIAKEELQSRVTVFVSDLKAEASAIAVDPAAAALEALVDSFVRANFGQAPERAHAISYRGSIDEKGQKREFVVFRKRPAKLRMHLVKDGLVINVIAFDGVNGWKQAPGKPPMRLPSAETAALAKMARFDSPLVTFRESGAQLTRESASTPGTLVLRIRERDGVETVSTIDQATMTEISSRSQRADGKEEETRFSDFRKIGVLNVAQVQAQWVDGTCESTTRISDVRIESGLLDRFFAATENQSLGFMDYMGAVLVFKERAAQAAAAAKNSSESKP